MSGTWSGAWIGSTIKCDVDHHERSHAGTEDGGGRKPYNGRLEYHGGKQEAITITAPNIQGQRTTSGREESGNKRMATMIQQ